MWSTGTSFAALASTLAVLQCAALPTSADQNNLAISAHLHLDGGSLAQHALGVVKRSHRGRPWRDDCQYYPGEERRHGYDCGHSQHWNYHQGYTNTDGSRHHRRGHVSHDNKHGKAPHRGRPSRKDHAAPTAKVHKKEAGVGLTKAPAKATPSDLTARALGPAALVPRRHADNDHYDGWFAHGRWHRHSGHRHHARRSATTRAPGFVEIAVPLAHSALAKTVAGLVTSASPSNNGTFDIGSSTSHATEFYLATNDPQADDQVVQLHVPLLNSETMGIADYCATFPVEPPSTLTLELCGPVKGASQDFSYNSETGELSPLLKGSSPAALDDGQADFVAEAQPLPHNLLIMAIDNAGKKDNSTLAPTSRSSAQGPPSAQSTSLPTAMPSVPEPSSRASRKILAALTWPSDSASSTSSAAASAPSANASSVDAPTMGLYWLPLASVEEDSDVNGPDAPSASPSAEPSSTSGMSAAIFAALPSVSATTSAQLTCTTTITCPGM